MIEQRLAALKSSDETVRSQATADFWQEWFHQKGADKAQLLLRSQALLEQGETARAEELLTQLVQAEPDFAEAWNRRAVLHYLQKNYQAALADCQRVIALVPYHFGALHGLGLSQAALGNYREAIAAFRQALAIQPYTTVNQRLILECTARLS